MSTTSHQLGVEHDLVTDLGGAVSGSMIEAPMVEETIAEAVITEQGPHRSEYQKQLIIEHAAALASRAALEEKDKAAEATISGGPRYSFERSNAAYSDDEMNAIIAEVRRSEQMPWLNVRKLAEDPLLRRFYGQSLGLKRR